MNSARFALILALIPLAAPAARADWQRDDASLAWRADGEVAWQLNFDAKAGKPFFHPLTVAGGPSLTNFKPEDHPWHYGLWFSWKYLNGANYWEESRATGRAEGRTSWAAPAIETHHDGSATVRFELTYTHPSGRVDLTETRELRISAPAADGSYTIDWSAHFTAGPEGALLDRTPMPGEPDGRVNGGYAGLSARLAPASMTIVSPEGPVTNFVDERARPSVPAVACNFAEGATPLGGLAILSDPANAAENAPWYLINGAQMHFACAAVLAPKPLKFAPGAQWDLRYRIAVRPGAWTPETLRAACSSWLGAVGSAAAAASGRVSP